MHVCIYECLHVCAYPGLKLMVGVILHDSPTLFIEAESLNQTQNRSTQLVLLVSYAVSSKARITGRAPGPSSVYWALGI